MRHLFVIIAVICAVIGVGLAQNRGNARYVAPDDFDDEITRAPRPTRGAAVRRQRFTTKAPEPAAVEDEVKAHQPPDSVVRTTPRRVPQRGSPQQVAPPPPPLPIEDSVSLNASPVEELPQAPPAIPEGRPPGTRRRRPKKRRRPQNAVLKVIEEPEKQVIASPGEETSSISDLLNDDKKRTGVFQNNPLSRNSASTYSSDPIYQPEKSQWESNQPSESQKDATGPQYYGPQPVINRLPVANSEPVGNSRGYLESSPAVPDVEASAPYVPKGPPSSAPNDASYIPILTPIRVPSEGSSRLPSKNYPPLQNKDTSRPSIPIREHTNRSPVGNPENIIRNIGAKPLHNTIPQPDEPSAVRSHSEVRLPENQQGFLSSQYAPTSFDSSEDLSAPNEKSSDENIDPPSSSNRLPNPSEIHYESIYPGFSDDQSRGSQRIAGSRQESEESALRNPVSSYTIPRRDIGTKPQDHDNDAEIDRRQASQYRPPLQRSGSRYKAEDSDRTRITDEQPPSSSIPRTRGPTRYPPPTTEYIPERTRSSTRIQSEPEDSVSNSRSPSTSQSAIRTRGSQRYIPDTVESAPRTTPRRTPVNSDELSRNQPSVGYDSAEDFNKNEERPSVEQSPRAYAQPSPSLRTETGPEDSISLRNTLRSRPQYEVRDVEPTHRYEESVEESDIYNPDYQLPQQTNSRSRLNQRVSLPSQQPSQPEYQMPSNRQQNRPEPQYQPQQNRPEPQYHPQQNRPEPQYQPQQNHRSRQQPQYQPPENPRTDNRQNQPSSRPQGRSRHQNEPSAAPPKSSAGRSNFKCPDAFGFFADPIQCDKYYECHNGTAEMHLCKDGLAFNENSSPKYLRCDSTRDVDCKSRPEFQEPQPTQNCPRQYGLFPHESDCTKFWNCVEGAASEVQCPPGLTYNDERATCDWADLVEASETSCKSEDLLGFTCPEPTAYDLQDGVYARYPHPDNCQLHFTCIKGADGLRRPRMLSCNEGLVFDSATSSCKRPEEVPGCEDFYGVRSQPPKKKPSGQSARREPDLEPEEHIEEPTPRPRRRGISRQVRN